MAVYNYVAKDERGTIFSGTYRDVDGTSALRRELDKMGYVLVKARRGQQAGGNFGRQGRIRQSEVVTFAYKFAGMFAAGLPILKCLESLEQQTDNPALRLVISDVRAHVGTGYSLKDAFAKHEDVFSEFFLGMVEAGEVGGKLDETLKLSAVYLEKQLRLKQKVQSAFIYPAFVTIMCLVVVGLLIAFVIPVFQKLYAQVRAPLPGPTLALIVVSSFVRRWWWAIVIVVAAIILLVRRLLGNKLVRARWDNFKLHMPIFGKLNRMLVVSQFIRTFAMLSSVGVSVIRSLEMANLVAHNQKMGEVTADLQKSIQTGATLAASLKEHPVFPPLIVQMATSGEDVHMLPEMLTRGAELLDSDIERKINSLLVKLEPALTLIMGLIVVFVLLGAYLPMFDYMGHLK